MGSLDGDASNAFNSLNRIVVLWNSRVTWPRCSQYLFNTYKGWAPLVLKGSASMLHSKEGITQGDPLSLFIYAIATLPLINTVDHPYQGFQVWYVDDASACAKLVSLKDWLLKLMKCGPSFSYYPEPNKSFIVVKENFMEEAHSLFDPLGVNIVLSHKLLGGVVGNPSENNQFVKESVHEWVQIVDHLAKIAQVQPQAAYAAFTRSVQNKWLHLQRLIPGCTPFFTELQKKITSTLLPSIFQCEISPNKRELLSLPPDLVG